MKNPADIPKTRSKGWQSTSSDLKTASKPENPESTFAGKNLITSPRKLEI
jgi:hypothetical protein